MASMQNAIEDYLRASELAVARLRQVTGFDDLMLAWRAGSLKQTDALPGIEYEFHGSGVCIEIEADDINVEVDFLPGGQLGGFDSWRLWQWVRRYPQKYPGFVSHQSVRDELQRMLENGEVNEVDGASLFRLNC